jgi:hypothetical protein
VSAEPLISKFLGDAPGVTNNTVDQHPELPFGGVKIHCIPASRLNQQQSCSELTGIRA